MLDLEEVGRVPRGLVDLEGAHDAEGRGAFERTDERRLAVEKMRRPRPALHLFRDLQLDVIDIDTREEYLPPLIGFFRQRARIRR